MTLLLNIIGLITITVFTIYMYKVWKLVKHNSLLVFVLSGLIALVLRILLLLVDFKMFTVLEIDIYRTILANVLWILFAFGAMGLYYEVKKLVGKKE